MNKNTESRIFLYLFIIAIAGEVIWFVYQVATIPTPEVPEPDIFLVEGIAVSCTEDFILKIDNDYVFFDAKCNSGSECRLLRLYCESFNFEKGNMVQLNLTLNKRGYNLNNFKMME